jgi:monoamine oxidase
MPEDDATMSAEPIIVVGAGAAGLMAARELARAGRRVTILEARARCGGRIYPLPEADFGYRAEGGPEYVHGETPVTRALLREAGLALQPVDGARWNAEGGVFSRRDEDEPYSEHLDRAMAALKTDLPIAEFLRRHFAAPQYDRLRRDTLRMVEGYDAADPEQASTLALADEWLNGGPNGGRIAEGYGALVDFLAAECRKHGAVLHLNAAVVAIEQSGQGLAARCANGDTHEGDRAILTVPVPLLREIALPPATRATVAAAGDIGFGNVVKLLLRFATRWWAVQRRELADLGFVRSDETIPVWWTQHPAEHPVLTGWFGGPKTQRVAQCDEKELIALGLTSLAGTFGLPAEDLRRDLVAARAINWANDPFARGAYSYATLRTRDALSSFWSARGGPVLFAGEALYRGSERGTVEAALASGLDAARAILLPPPSP